LSLLGQSHLWNFEEVYVWREGSEEVEDVVAAVVTNDTLALHTAAQLNLFSLVIDDLVWKYFQLISGLL
jgi:hypothetical protein